MAPFHRRAGRTAVLLVLAAALTAGVGACGPGSGGSGSASAANVGGYPCGRKVPALDRAADIPDDVLGQPAKAAEDAHGLADQLRQVADKSTNADVKSALKDFATAYDGYGDAVATGKVASGDVTGLDKAVAQISAAGERLDRACGNG